jgi:hypothetical protein
LWDFDWGQQQWLLIFHELMFHQMVQDHKSSTERQKRACQGKRCHKGYHEHIPQVVVGFYEGSVWRWPMLNKRRLMRNNRSAIRMFEARVAHFGKSTFADN